MCGNRRGLTASLSVLALAGFELNPMIVIMTTIISGGRTVYGQALGVLMLDTVFPRLAGDIGNALTWPFPVQYKIVRGARADRIMGESPDPALLEPFILAAKELESEGVRAIATSCGFLAAFQRELAEAVSVPVLTSALLQVPLVSQMLGPSSSVGILTERPNLTEQHFRATGWGSDQFEVHVNALEPNAVFPTVFIDGGREADVQVLRSEMVQAAQDLVKRRPDTGAIVLECTNFVPFSAAIREASGLPVYDIYTLVMQNYLATVGQSFPVRLD